MLQTLVYSYSETSVNRTLNNPKTLVNHMSSGLSSVPVLHYLQVLLFIKI